MRVDTNEASETAIDADLRRLDLHGLRRQWRNLSGKAAPPGLTRSLLQRMIAYEEQASRLGGLSSATVRMLDRIAAGAKGDDEGSVSRQVARATGSDRRFAPGTILVREWQGVLHRVTVMKEGFAWNGTTYGSLSRVAREITGTAWNGHVFFGGTDKAGKKRVPASKEPSDLASRPRAPQHIGKRRHAVRLAGPKR